MKRNAPSIVKKSRVYMLLMGVIVGIIFPFFTVIVLNLNPKDVLNTKFFVSCIIAGILVGLLSSVITSITILNKLTTFHEALVDVVKNIKAHKQGMRKVEECDCFVLRDTSDIIGDIQEKYNELVETIRNSFLQHQHMDQFFTVLNHSIEFRNLNKNVVKFITETVQPVLAAEIYCFNEHNKFLKCGAVFAHNAPTEQFKDFLQDVLESREVMELEEKNLFFIEGLFSVRPNSVALFPIANDTNKVGVLAVYLSRKLMDDERGMIGKLLNQYTLAYQSSLSFNRVQDMASIDELTRINNRRNGIALTEDVLEKAYEDREPVSLLIMDIDHFKQVNDTYGHQAGDMILRVLSEKIKNMIRGTDIFLRYGGEEFLIVMPGTHIDDSYKRSEIIRKAVEESEFLWNNNSIQVTISLGLSCTEIGTQNNYDLDTLLTQADEALYLAKEQGRNRSVLYMKCE
ncbi:GGDEF domain-containing protein [Limisalsivibrio acetivorans]|uniref:GGDEF domain-containing protein n=1 Tax=Limisalsivibrio acetivorans TaxID=1304888 RepID=UPI0003B6B38C|nr:GGDEF domain-containing protein [Limisalsivibrio acetivorans]